MAVHMDPTRIEYMLDRVMREISQMRHHIEETRKDQYHMMRTFHSYVNYVEKLDPRIREGFLMSERFKESTK